MVAWLQTTTYGMWRDVAAALLAPEPADKVMQF